ncbi:MAG: SAM-dependent methyltransferase [Bradymonadia bacterium]|jgi:SAM-dependent methyltransferase
MKLDYPATQRNKDAIASALRTLLPSAGTVLEVASGSGQHCLHFATEFPDLAWQPSSYESEERASIGAYVAEAGRQNLYSPLDLNVLQTPWPLTSADAVFCANMIHIAPWDVSEGLFAGAASILAAGSPLLTYGPYRFQGEFTSPSNQMFDERLRSRNPAWGVRELDDLIFVGSVLGLVLSETLEMPANNHLLVWIRA